MLKYIKISLYSGKFKSINECIMCHGKNCLKQKHVVKKKSMDYGQAYYQCEACGFVFSILTNPVSDSFYEEDYNERYCDRTGIDFKYRNDEASELSACLKNSGITPGNVLEVGPGPGWFMEGFLAHNPDSKYDVVELNSMFSDLCKKAGANKVYNYNFEKSGISNLCGKYDVVVSIHSIEHFFNPLAAFANLLRCVKPGGILYVHTPNSGNARDNNWYHYSEEHLGFFGADSFRVLGGVLGYDVLASLIAYDNNDIICIMRPRGGLGWRLKRALLARSRRAPVL